MSIIKKILDFFKPKPKKDKEEIAHTKLYLLGNEAVCPLCAGCVKKSIEFITWHCNDCDTVFIVDPREKEENDREISVLYFLKGNDHE